MIVLKLAWRNLWRNRNRTMITMASVFFAVLLAILVSSLQKGVYDNIIREAVNFYSGYLQIHKVKYWDERVLENSMILLPQQLDSLQNNSEIQNVSTRLESFVLASNGEKTKGCFLVGIEPSKEAEMILLNEKIVEGNYLTDKDDGIVLAQGLAKKLQLKLNDTIVILGQGYQGATAAGKYPVKGILKFGALDLNDLFLFMPLAEVQYLLSADSVITSYVIIPRNTERLDELKKTLTAQFGGNYEVHTWKELMPYLDQHIRMCTAGGFIFIGILYILVAFGIFGTLMMMMTERAKEFIMLVNIGMHRRQLSFTVLIESIFVTLTGCILGALVSIPIVYYFKIYPITVGGKFQEAYASFGFGSTLPASTDPQVFIDQSIVILLIALVLLLYPFIKILILKPERETRK